MSPEFKSAASADHSKGSWGNRLPPLATTCRVPILLLHRSTRPLVRALAGQETISAPAAGASASVEGHGSFIVTPGEAHVCSAMSRDEVPW